jgi:hypothetical protein
MFRGAVTPRLLQRLCYDLVQRGPTEAERRNFVGAEVGAVVPRLLQSREAKAEWFEEQLYYFLLLDQFRPRGEAIDRIPARLQKGELDARAAIAEIVLSTGFSLRNPGNDTFVTVLLEQCLGYRVQDKDKKPVLEAGKKIYDGKKGRFLGRDAATQADLVQAVLQHPDFARHLLARQHERLFGAPLPKDAPEVAAVQQDWTKFFAVIGDWLQGGAYAQAVAQRRGKSERQFLRGLYQDLLERAPGEDELRNLRNALTAMADPAPLRAVLAKVILDSKDARLPARGSGHDDEFVRQCFLRYLAREPGDSELRVFTGALQQGASPLQIVRALVGSLEYQTY